MGGGARKVRRERIKDISAGEAAGAASEHLLMLKRKVGSIRARGAKRRARGSGRTTRVRSREERGKKGQNTRWKRERRAGDGQKQQNSKRTNIRRVA